MLLTSAASAFLLGVVAISQLFLAHKVDSRILLADGTYSLTLEYNYKCKVFSCSLPLLVGLHFVSSSTTALYMLAG